MSTFLSSWAQELKSKYLRGEASQFVLAGNIYDYQLVNGKLLSLNEYLQQELLAKKEIILSYNTATGVHFHKGGTNGTIKNRDKLLVAKSPSEALPEFAKLLSANNNIAVIMEYAESIVPAMDWSFATEDDRAAVITMHSWSLAKWFQDADNIVLLLTETLSELNAKLLANPKIAVINVPFPTYDERRALIKQLNSNMPDNVLDNMAEQTAGLKLRQIESILKPSDVPVEDMDSRVDFIYNLLQGDDISRRQRAKDFASMTQDKTREEIMALIAPGSKMPEESKPADAYQEVYSLIFKRKREIIEKECFGLVEIVDKNHDFSAVGGNEGIKTVLRGIANNMRDGQTRRVPMGLLFVGPMGTGKTFVAEAFAKESGFAAIKLKNFRSKWVGSTESNLEKILSIVKAIGQVIVIIDEGDRSFGSTGDSDGGTNSRVIARLKEFMSDTTNRGRILFVMMTNRPDKLDVDLKRAGRLDRKIPFFYSDEPREIEAVLQAVFARNKMELSFDLTKARAKTSAKLTGYSNADIEAVALLAGDIAAQNDSQKIKLAHLEQAVNDYLPARDANMLHYMELLAVFESSSRTMLPKRYQDLSREDLLEQLEIAKIKAGANR